jgi:glutamate racemase
VGGLTVFEKLKKLLPDENYIYFGDTENMPYGEKTSAQLLKITRRIFDFFEQKNVKAVVMACNTTSATVYEELKDKYPFKIYPVIQSVAKFLAQLPVKKICVPATPATVNSKTYSREIQKLNPAMEVIEAACPEWVKIVEGRSTEPENKLIEEKMKEILLYNPDKIVLGCTHYPYLLPVLSKFAPEDMFIDPAGHFAQIIAKDMQNDTAANSGGSEKFYVSASPENFVSAGKMFYNVKELPELLNLNRLAVN